MGTGVGCIVRAMTANELPEDIQALLHERLESYEELHILLLLIEQRRDWSVEEIAARLKLTHAAIDSALVSLARNQLVTNTGEPQQRRHRYADSPLDAAVTALATIYKERPIAVIRFMSTFSIERIRAEALRAFADAFLLRKDK